MNWTSAGCALILAASFFSPVLAKAAKPSDQSKTADGAFPRDLLKAAHLFAAALARDDRYGPRYLSRVAEAQAEAGQLEAAAGTSDKIPGYRRWMVVADLARRATGVGEKELSRRWRDSVAAGRRSSDGWRADYIAAHEAAAAAAADEGQTAAELVAGITDDDARRIAKAEVAVAQFANHSGEITQLMRETPDPLKTQPSLLRIADAARRIALQMAKHEGAKEEAIAKLLEAIGFARKARIPAGIFYLAALKDLRDLHATEELEAELPRVAAEIRSYSVELPERPALVAGLAELIASTGARESAVTLLTEQEKHVPRIENLFRAAAWSQVALGWYRIGEKEKAEILWTKALDDTGRHENYIVRAITGLEVCLAHAEAGAPLSDNLSAGLTSLLLSVEPSSSRR